jgi:hypothetical protein
LFNVANIEVAFGDLCRHPPSQEFGITFNVGGDIKRLFAATVQGSHQWLNHGRQFGSSRSLASARQRNRFELSYSGLQPPYANRDTVSRYSWIKSLRLKGGADGLLSPNDSELPS